MAVEFHLQFENVGLGKANLAATQLRQQLLRAADSDVRIEIKKENQQTQDMGATLVLVLGTAAARAIMKGISDFIAKSGDSVVILTPNGKVVARGGGATKLDVAKTVAALMNSNT